MASPRQPVQATEFYTETVLPALAERLDQTFPEFGWRRDSRGWVATNEEFTHTASAAARSAWSPTDPRRAAS